MNNDAIIFFEKMSNKQNVDQNTVKLVKKNDFTELDKEFILQYCSPDSTILELGAGTGLITNKLKNHVKYIEAIEPFKKFSDFIEKSNNINIINTTSQDYTIEQQFDIILCFGFCHYFNEHEVKDFYKKFYNALKPNGIIIVKNQFGVNTDVTIDGAFSEELKTNYFSQYRTLAKEKDILTSCGYNNIMNYNIYPDEYNRWDNTHFYAIIAHKNI